MDQKLLLFLSSAFLLLHSDPLFASGETRCGGTMGDGSCVTRHTSRRPGMTPRVSVIQLAVEASQTTNAFIVQSDPDLSLQTEQ
jgi:hypothetical protein